MRNSINMLALSMLMAAFLPGTVFAEAPGTAHPVIASGAASAPAAAPSPMQNLAPELKTRYWFGVAVENIPPAIARQLKLKPSQGLMVSAVLPNSPAERAGLKAEDLLIDINGRPLTAQEDLFVAANSLSHSKGGSVVKSSRLTYLRDGDPTTVEITPEQRPEQMIVFDSPNKPQGPKFKNYVAPNGGGAQVGTGYRVNLESANPADVTVKSIKAIVSQGQTIVLSRETDLAGGVTNTITLGANVYPVVPGHIDALPANLQPIALQLISGSAGTTQVATPAASAPLTLEKRMKVLEAQNAELRKQLQELLHERRGAAPMSQPAAPH